MKKKITSLTLTLLLGLFSWNAAAQVAIHGATGITDGTSYTTLKGAFDAINANASGINTDNIEVRVSDNTTETTAASLNYYQGLYISASNPGSGYQAPTVSLSGGTGSGGNVAITIVNGVIKNIVMTGGSYSVKPTSVTISAGTGSGATATVEKNNGTSGSNGNLIFTVTNGGTGYGPTASISAGGGSGATVDVIMTTASTALANAPTTVGLSYALTNPGTGYTSSPTCSISTVSGGASLALTPCADIKYNTIVVYPTVAGKTISGSVGLLSIVGRQKVTIDGRVNAAGAPTVGHADNLIFSTTSPYYPVVTLDGDAQNNTIKYCTLKGNNNNSNSGLVLIGATASTTNGNGNNIIDHNLITNNGGQVLYGLYAIGNTTKPNVGNQITYNYFQNILNSNLLSNALFVQGGLTASALPQNDNFTISGNSFHNSGFDSAAGSTRQMIAIGTSTNTFGGSHTITDNFFGSTAANCSGVNIVKYSQGSHLYVITIYASPSTIGGGATSIQNNTIQKISWQNGGNANFIGIYVLGSGDVNIGTVTGNTIGDNSGTGSIVCSNFGSSAGSTTGISIANTGTVNCQKNKIGSITAWNGNATTATAAPFNGIQKTATAGNVTISNNIIGSTTTANSIYAYRYISSTIQVNPITQNVYPILFQGTGTGTISNNTIANVTNYTTLGNLSAIYLNGAGSTTTINANLIHSNTILGFATGGSNVLSGIMSSQGVNTITNNIVKLGDNNAAIVRGIVDNTSTSTGAKIYHNTVYISGTPTSDTFTSACIFNNYNASQTAKDYRNNILVNTRSRSGATDEHYAFHISSNTATGLTTNGNNYYVTGTGGLNIKTGTGAGSNGTTTFSGQDANSVSVNPSFTNAGGTTAESYVPSFLLLIGIDLSATVTADYNGVSRTATPTMGALDYRIWNGSAWNTAPTTDYNAKIDGTYSGAGFACRNLVLSAGKQISITSGTLAVANNFTILSDAANGTGTYINTGALTVGGTTTVQQYVTSTATGATGRNWYISSPLSAAVSSTITSATGNTLVYYDGTTPWANAGATMEVMKGYIAVSPAQNTTINFTGGTLNTGDKSVSNLPLGFNLVGNPYPSYVDFAQATKTNVTNSIWYRSKKEGTYNFHTYNVTGGVSINDGTAIIAPMQSFWIKTTSATNTFGFNNDMRSHQDQTVAVNRLKAPKVSTNKLVRLQVSNAANRDEAVIYFNSAAQNTVDDFDSQKMFESATATKPEIFTTVDNQKLAINGLNSILYDVEIPVGFIAKQTGDFSISRTEFSNFESGTRILLKDKLYPTTEFELAEGASYNFSSQPTTATTDRFSLVFRAPGVATGIDNATKPNAQVFVNAANQITIIAPVKSNYAIYNAMGQLIYNGALNTERETLNAKLNAGVYVVKVGNVSTRVVVK